MSLIVARQDGNQIAIVSDTKLTYPNHDIKAQKENPTEGVIKIIILNNNLCISFAGDIEYAERAFIEIGDNPNNKNAIDVLKKYHAISNHETEFLICFGKPEPLIIEIKNNECKQVKSAWIGDNIAFNRFQENMMGKKKPKEIPMQNDIPQKSGMRISEMNISFEIDTPVKLFSKISASMDDVIEDSSIDSVGGFKVGVVYDEKFEFIKYGKFYRGNIEMFGKGPQIIGHGTASEGAYSINFFGGSSDYKAVGLHVRQGDFGLLYTRNNFGLLRPELIQLDEVDFMQYAKDAYNLDAEFGTQDSVQKYFLDGKKYLEKKAFLKAKNSFEKSLSVSS